MSHPENVYTEKHHFDDIIKKTLRAFGELKESRIAMEKFVTKIEKQHKRKSMTQGE